MKVVVCHQPQVFWSMHLVHRVFSADEFVLMDRAQINRKVGMTKYRVARFEKKGANIIELTIPFSGGSRASVSEAVAVSDGDWKDKHMKTLESCYSTAPHWSSLMKMVEQTFLVCSSLADFGSKSFYDAESLLGLSGFTAMKMQSELKSADLSGARLVLAMVKELGGCSYLCGNQEDRPYITDEFLKENGVEAITQSFVPPALGNLSWIHYYAWGGAGGVMRAIRDGSIMPRYRF